MEPRAARAVDNAPVSEEEVASHPGGVFYDTPPPELTRKEAADHARNAGRHADDYVALGVPPSTTRAVLLPAFEKGAREAGKGPAARMTCARVSTRIRPDREETVKGARVYGGLLIPEAYHHIRDPRVIEQRALLDAFCVATTGKEVIARFESFIEAGCNHMIWPDMSRERCSSPSAARPSSRVSSTSTRRP